MPGYSVYHNVPVILQGKSHSCWHTCMKMITHYSRSQGKFPNLKDPDDEPILKGYYIYNKGLPNVDAVRLTTKLGYGYASLSPTIDGLGKLLKETPIIYGGMWDKTDGHWVIISGISEEKLCVINPLRGRFTYDWPELIEEMKQDGDLPFFFPKN